MLRRLLAAIAAGVVLALAFEPVALAYVAVPALAALALALRGVRCRAGWLLGAAFGLTFFLVHIWWMRASIGTGAWIGLSVEQAFWFGLFGAAAPLLHRLAAWPAWLAAAWTTVELVRSTWPWGGMPWGRLGFGVVDTPLAPALAYLGVNGVGFVVAVLGFLVARLVLAARGERLLAATGVVGLAAVATLPVAFPFTLAVAGTTTVAAVQGDVPGAGDNVLADPDGVTANQVEATVGLAEAAAAGEVPAPDFVVWAENSTVRDPFVDSTTAAGVEAAVAAVGVPVLVGGIVGDGPDHILNQGIVWDPVTGPGERYTKRHPVPFGEWIPLRGLLERFGLDDAGQLALIPRDMRSGDRDEPLVVGGVPVADAICFDIAYDDGLAAQQRAGAQLITVQTSNASFIFTEQIEQQFALTRARALESGRTVVVAALNGVSGVIEPDGTVVERTRRRTQEVIVQQVTLRDGLTPGLAVGDAFWVLAPAVTGLGLLLVLGRRRSRSEVSTESMPVREPV